MAHVNEKLDFCVEVFIVYKNKVLLRMHDKYKIWLSVGGHIDPGEDPIEAALREVKEEVGLDIKIIGETQGPIHGTSENRGYKYLTPPRYMGRHPVNDIHEHVALVYFATADTYNIAESINEHEQTETRWVGVDELSQMDLIPNVKFYATEALKELGK